MRRCETYDYAAVKRAVEQSIADIWGSDGVGKLLKPNAKVLIKPNLLKRAAPEAATTTHPTLVRAVAELFVAAGAKVTIADSPGGLYSAAVLQKLYEETGMAEAAKLSGAVLNTNPGHSKVEYRQHNRTATFDIINPVLEADLIVDIAKLKTHAFATYTGAVKNMFGCVPGLTKGQYHMRKPDSTEFANMLIDLCCCVPPAITIIDGIIGMEGDGPAAGQPRAVNAIITSDSPYEADLVACRIIGLSAIDVPTLYLAHSRGLCADNCYKLELTGGSDSHIDTFIVRDFKKPKQDHWMSRNIITKNLTVMPAVNRRKCTGCKQCVTACPADVISKHGNKIEFDYAKCIRCFCCHELCPEKAIELKRRWRKK